MEIAVCKQCKKMFNKISNSTICSACQEKLETVFQQVKDYLWENKGASLSEISEKFDVSPKQIEKWLRDGRLQLAEDSVINFTCVNCGEKITTGKYCVLCARKVERELSPVTNNAVKPQKVHDKDRMRFLNS